MRPTVTRFSDYVQRTFGIKGSTPQGAVIEDVMPVIGLVDPTDVEHHWTRNEVLWTTSQYIGGGGAGAWGRLQIVTSPGYITVIEAMQVYADSGACSYIADLTLGVLGGVPNVAFQRADARGSLIPSSPGAQGYVSTPAAPAGGILWRCVVGNLTSVLVPLGCVLNEGARFTVGCLTPNFPLCVNVWGYDRLAEDWELA